MSIGAKIAELRTKRGISQTELAELLGTTKQTIYKYETGLVTNIPLDKIERISEVLETSPSHLMGWDSPPKESFYSEEAQNLAKDYDNLDNYGKRVVRLVADEEKARCEDESRFLVEAAPEEEPKVINLYLNPAAAGYASPVFGQDFEPYTLGPRDPKGAEYAVRLQGDSMEPYFPDGSVVFVNRDPLADGDIGIFCVDGGAVCKQYHRDPAGCIYLFSLNRKRADADIFLPPSSGRSLVCQGRVMSRKRFPLPGRE